jgi:ankyrin repeat protein
MVSQCIGPHPELGNLLYWAATRGYGRDMMPLVAMSASLLNDHQLWGALRCFKRAKERTFMMAAARFGHTKRLKWMLGLEGKDKKTGETKFGVGVSIADDNGNTALHWAAEYGHASCIEPLVKAGANVDAANSQGETPLMLASAGGHEQCVRALWDSNASADARDRQGKRALHHAAAGGHASVVRVLLKDFGARVESIDNYRKTPLQYACQNKKLEAATALLKAGADTSEALAVACSTNMRSLVRKLLDHGAEDDGRLLLKYGSSHPHLAEMLLPHCSNPGRVDPVCGDTALHRAADVGAVLLASAIVTNGIPGVDAVNHEGDTALHSAAKAGDCSGPDGAFVAEKLLEGGASIDPFNDDGFAPIHLAALYGNVPVLKVLLAYGAMPNQIGGANCTPLHLACRPNDDRDGVASGPEDHLGVVKTLMASGASIVAKDEDGDTPLHIACQEGLKDIALYLKAHGAFSKTENTAGESPLRLADEEGHEDLAALLAEEDGVEGEE